MAQKFIRLGQSVLASRFRLALVATLVTASQLGAGRPTAARPLETGTFKVSTSRVWAAVTVDSPIIQIDQPINVTFAATNLSDMPILMSDLRDDTVLVINGKEWAGSRFTFSNGARPVARFLEPGKSMMFVYQLTSVFKEPGLYRIVWRGKDFETLPLEFRVAKNPF
jgi:hypothetical protein